MADVESLRTRWGLIAAIFIAVGLCGGIYAALDQPQTQGLLLGIGFLFLLPASISAIICAAMDRSRTMRLRNYLLVPLYVMLVAIVLGAVILREGVICILMLAPPWLAGGLVGAAVTYALRRRMQSGRTYCAAVLAIPLIMLQIEPTLPAAERIVIVSRSTDVRADPATIWPLVKGIPKVRRGEGQWNVTQDVIGVPRPLGARLIGTGIGAQRLANWGAHVRFMERITIWQPGRRIGWQFLFDDMAGWAYVDRHLMPDSAYLTVLDGGYALRPLRPGVTRVTIETRYRVRTRLNRYAALWGELLLGDLEDNLLALIAGRAEDPRAS